MTAKIATAEDGEAADPELSDPSAGALEQSDMVVPPIVEEGEDADLENTRGVAPSFVVFPDLDLLSRPLWQAICAEARRRLPSPGDQTLLAGSQLCAREQSVLIVGIKGRSAVQRAELRLGEPLSRVARALLGRPVDVRFVSLDPG